MQSISTVIRTGVAICVAVLSLLFPARGQVYVGGVLTSNETYSPDNNPYIVTQDLIVSSGITLTILPGVEMLFEYGTSLISNGTLIAKGSPDQKISFLPKNPQTLSGQWNGISFDSNKTLMGTDSSYISGSVLSDAIISNASRSVILNKGSALLIEAVDIRNCSFGIYLNESGYTTIRNSKFTYCDFGIFIASGFRNPENKIYGNTIYGSSDVGIFINSDALYSHHNQIHNNSILACGIGLHIGNYSNNGEANNVISHNIFHSNKDAIRLFHKSNSISNNYFVLNRNGIICWQSDYNAITRNLFSRNKLYAVTLAAGSSFNTITYNSMNYNSGGVKITPDSSRLSVYNSFLYNTLFKNTDWSFQIMNTPQGAVQFNNLIFNGAYQSFLNQSDSLVHGEYNFWGTIAEAEIDSIIYDFNDIASLGEVLYDPILNSILTTAPVPPPHNVIKQLIGDDVVVSWHELEMADINGYIVYYGSNDGIVYENSIPNGMNTSINLGSIPVIDSVSVTAIDFSAGGLYDQTNGYESDFAFATLYPYAGPDTAICFNNSYAISNATAVGSGILTWSTSGDGAFNNSNILNPVYVPGPQDNLNGFVSLFLTSEEAESSFTDAALITFHDAPEAFAGNDTLIVMDSALRLESAYAISYDFVKWTTSGDGTFDSDVLNNPTYTPGQADKAAGSVVLTFTAFSTCGSASDQISLEINQGYFIEGRIHAGNVLALQSNLLLFQQSAGQVKPFRSGTISTDGNFKINALFEGTYYLCAIPDKESSPGFLPTYYFNDIHWKNAHKLELNTNTYDVDIDLVPVPMQLPVGDGSIFGICTTVAGSTESCGEVTVFLLDNQKKNILDWFVVRKGIDFRFKNLPFGEYILAGEKAGTPFFYSQSITLTPANPLFENIELICTPEGFRFTMPENPGFISGSIGPTVFPNPFVDNITFSGLPEKGTYDVHIINSQGLVEKYSIEIGDIQNNTLFLLNRSSGFYILELWKNNVCQLRYKLIKL